MKLYFYTFLPDGEVLKEIISVRKNKYHFAVDAYTTYGGYEHRLSSRLSRESENKIIGASSTAGNGCYMYSTAIKEITDDMRAFSQKRSVGVNKIMELEKELRCLSDNLKFADLGK